MNKNSSRLSSTNYLVGSIFVALFAVIGVYLLIGSRASSPYASVNADKGTLANGAAAQASAAASDGSYVQFNGTGGGGKTGIPWIGLNDFTGWGPPLTHQYLSDGFRWARIEAGGAYTANNGLDNVLSPGCGDGNSSDSSLLCNALLILPEASAVKNSQGQITGWDTTAPMSWMNHYNTAAYASRIVYEFGNEAYLTNSGYSLTAQQYAQSYEATYNAKHAASVSQPLLFMTTGDPCWTGLAVDTCTNGAELYLEKAMDVSKGGVSNLEVDGFSTHTYGGADSDTSNHTNGVDALLAQHQDAVNHGFTNTPWYVTEWGVTINPAQSDGPVTANTGYYAPSYAGQAADITSAYTKMVAYGDGASGTWLKGIMYYQTHDDSTGWFGLLTSPNAPSHDNAGEVAGGEVGCQTGQPPPPCGNANTPITLRPAYSALKAFLTNH